MELNNLMRMYIQFDANLIIYYLLNAYVNMDVVYFEAIQP